LNRPYHGVFSRLEDGKRFVSFRQACMTLAANGGLVMVNA
jgi:hypothetical protein